MMNRLKDEDPTLNYYRTCAIFVMLFLLNIVSLSSSMIFDTITSMLIIYEKMETCSNTFERFMAFTNYLRWMVAMFNATFMLLVTRYMARAFVRFAPRHQYIVTPT